VLKRILVAYYGSPSSLKAVSFAMELAEASAAQIKLLVVAQLPEPPSKAESSAKIRLTTERFADAFAHIKTEGRSHGIDIETKVVEGDPANEIVQQAADERSDLIIMGHRGHNPLKEWLLGSTSKRVVTHAPCSVTIVR
jgi:nucleotide-binding universal stress UspA family protein